MSCVRIAMWSGPRNISTAMMRSFENRPDCAVIDEPLYAHYLIETGVDHPMRADVLAAQRADWRAVTAELTTAEPAPIYFQKHMCHHVTSSMGTDWLDGLKHMFLIRDPARVIASYAAKMETMTLEGLGLPAQLRLFERVSLRAGAPPPVIDAEQVLADPKGALSALCAALAIPFTEAMLSWPPGPRASDGVWAPHWYGSVERSTGFLRPPTITPELPGHLTPLLEEARPYYEALSARRI
jgi:hypothetical protein